MKCRSGTPSVGLQRCASAEAWAWRSRSSAKCKTVSNPHSRNWEDSNARGTHHGWNGWFGRIDLHQDACSRLSRGGNPFGVTVNTISPGYIGTKMVTTVPKEVLVSKILPQIPLGRLG